MNLPTAQRPPARRIVCGVDGSEQARHAASAALRLADRLGAQLTLVHVTPTRSMAPVDSFPWASIPAPTRARPSSPSPRPRLRSTPCSSDVAAASVEREVRLGEPAAVLAEVAADCGAEMIVVGSRGRGAWRSAVLGSVSSDVARLAPCPVMIVPERAAVEAARPEGVTPPRDRCRRSCACISPMMRSARARTSRGSTPSVVAMSSTRTLANSMPTIGRSSASQSGRGCLDGFGVGRRHLRLPGGDGVDGGQQHLDGIVLGDDRVGLGERRGHREDVVDVGGVEDDARRVAGAA